MSRWHDQHCLQPHIEVADGVPKCHACGRVPPLTELIVAANVASSFPSIPPDEPVGQMNLWWPCSVPYRASTRLASESHATQKPLPTETGTTSTEDLVPAITAPLANSNVYPQTISSNEFRLITLSSVKTYDFPVHLDLEVFSLDNCPEYETVSYTWGGEDGDSSLRCPIYIGPFWDVLLQTNNCWEMLRFLRPWRGVRMVWVDAICINQSNIPERNSQVANMNRIYSECSRVVLYLGPDIAVPLRGRHPRRCPLHELEAGSAVPEFPGVEKPPRELTLTKLLERRYFTRVWVVQELILSRQVVIRVGHIDFWADPKFYQRVCDSKWVSTPAPWVRHVAQGTSEVRSFSEVLTMTSKALSADPRDRVFGLLGIAPKYGFRFSDDDVGPPLDTKADYSISPNHVFIGIFAYCMICLRMPGIFHHSSGLTGSSNYPSWAPDWSLQKEWNDPFEFEDELTTDMDPRTVQDLINSQLRSLNNDSYLCELRRGHWRMNVKPWYDGACVDNATGALSMTLVQCLTFRSKPVKVITRGKSHIFALYPGEKFQAWFTLEYPRDEICWLGNEQLFLLSENSDAEHYMGLILRPCDRERTTFTFVSTCRHVFFAVVASKLKKEVADLSIFEFEKLRSGRAQPKFGRMMKHFLAEFLVRGPAILDTKLGTAQEDESGELRALFPDVETYRTIFPFLVGIYWHLEVPEGSPGFAALEPRFFEEFLAYINPNLRPRIEANQIVLTFEGRFVSEKRIWESYVKWANSTPPKEWENVEFYEHCEFRTQGSEWVRPLRSLHSSKVPYRAHSATDSPSSLLPGGLVELRVHLKRILDFIDLKAKSKVMKWLGDIFEATRLAKENPDDVLSMLTTRLTDDDRSDDCTDPELRHRPWSKFGRDIRAKLGIYGDTRMVTIV